MRITLLTKPIYIWKKVLTKITLLVNAYFYFAFLLKEIKIKLIFTTKMLSLLYLTSDLFWYYLKINLYDISKLKIFIYLISNYLIENWFRSFLYIIGLIKKLGI